MSNWLYIMYRDEIVDRVTNLNVARRVMETISQSYENPNGRRSLEVISTDSPSVLFHSSLKPSTKEVVFHPGPAPYKGLRR